MADDMIRVQVGAAPESAAQLKSDLDKMASGIEIEVKAKADKASEKYWQGRFKEGLSDMVAQSTEMKKMGAEYKKLESSADSFHRRNMTGIDFEIKKREEAAKLFSKQLKSRMAEEAAQAKETEKINASRIKEASKIQLKEEPWLDTSKQSVQIENLIRQARSLKEIGVDASASITQLNQAFDNLKGSKTIEEYNKNLAIFDNTIKDVKQDFKDLIPKDAFDVKKLSDSVATWMNKNKTAAKAFATELQEIQKLLSGDVVSVGDANQAKQAFDDIKSSAKAMGIEGQTAGEKFGNMFKKFTQWFGVSRIIMETVQMMKQMISTTIELDGQLNNIRMVTGASNEEAQKMFGTYQQLAGTIGSTTSEVLTSADAFLRQGRSVADTNELIRVSQILSKVGMMESAEAAELLTSSINGYQVSAQEAISVVDKMTAIDAAAATSTQELAKALAETATSAKLAGLSMDEILSYIATVSDVTRDSAESIGNAFKTILARMGEVKLGSLVDPESGEDISKVETVLKQYNIQLRNSEGLFRDVGDVLNELSQRWGTLNNVQKNEIATQIGGIRGREKILVLLENYDKALALQNVSLESAGSAQERFGIYLESLAAKLAEFTNAFQGMTAATVDSGFVGWVIELGTGILNLITSIGGLGPIITTVISVLVALKSTKIATFFTDIASSVQKAIPALISYVSSITSSTTAMEGAKIAAMGLGASLGSILGAIGVAIAAFTIIRSIVMAVGTESERAAKKVEEASKNYDETKSRLEQVSSELKTASSRIDELNSKKKLTLVEKEELQKLKDVTAELLLQEDILARKEERAKVDLAKAQAESYEKRFGDQQFNLDAINKSIEEAHANSSARMLMTNKDNINAMIAAYSYMSDMRAKALDTYNEAIAAGEDASMYEDSIMTLSDTISDIEANLFDAIPELQKFVSSVESIPEDKRIEIFGGDWQNQLENAKGLVEGVYKSLAPEKWDVIQFSEVVDAEGLKEELQDLANAGKLTAATLNDPKYSTFVSKMAELGFSVEDIINQFTNLSQAVTDAPSGMSDLALSFDKIIDKTELFNKAQSEFEKSGYISSETFKELGASASDYMDVLFDSTGAWLGLDGAMSKLRDTEQKSLSENVAKRQIELNKSIEDGADAIELYKETFGDIEEIDLGKLDTKIQEVGNKMVSEFDKGSKSIDLLNRPIIDVSENMVDTLVNAGDSAEDLIGQWATLASFSQKFGNEEILLTPILPDGTVLDSNQLNKYINDLIEAGDVAAIKQSPIYLGSFEDAESADAYAVALHNAQEEYYSLVKAKQALAGLTGTEAQEILNLNVLSQSLSAIGYESLIRDIEKVYASYDALTSAMSENTLEGKVSFDTYKQLTSLNKDYEKLLTRTTNGYKLNSAAAEAERQRLESVRKALGDTKIAYENYQNALKTPTKTEQTYDVLNKAVKTLQDGLKSGMTETDEFHAALKLLFGDTRPENLSKSLKDLDKLTGAGAKGAEKMYGLMRKYSKDGELDMQKFQKAYNLSDEAMAGFLSKWEELGLISSTMPSFDTIANGMGLTAKQAVNLESKLENLFHEIKLTDISDADSKEKLEKILKGYKLTDEQKNKIRKDWKYLNEGLSQDTVLAFTGLSGLLGEEVQKQIDEFLGKDIEVDLLSGLETGELTLEDYLDTGALEESIRKTLKEIGLMTDAEIDRIMGIILGRTVELKLEAGITASVENLGLGEELTQKITDAILASYDPSTGTYNIPVAVTAIISSLGVETDLSPEEFDAAIKKAIEGATGENGEVDVDKLTANLTELGIELPEDLPEVIKGLQSLNEQKTTAVQSEVSAVQTNLEAAQAQAEAATTSLKNIDDVKMTSVTSEISSVASGLETVEAKAKSAKQALDDLNSTTTPSGSGDGAGAPPQGGSGATPTQKTSEVSQGNVPNINVTATIVSYVEGEGASVQDPSKPTSANIGEYKDAGDASVQNPSTPTFAQIDTYRVMDGAKVDPPTTPTSAEIDTYNESENASVQDPTQKTTAEIGEYNENADAAVQGPSSPVEALISAYTESGGASVQPPSGFVEALINAYIANENAGVEQPTSLVNALIGMYISSENAAVEQPSDMVNALIGQYIETQGASSSKSSLLNSLTGQITKYDDSGAEKPKLEVTATVVYEGTPESVGEAGEKLSEPKGAFGLGGDTETRVKNLTNDLTNLRAAYDEGAGSADLLLNSMEQLEYLANSGSLEELTTFAGEFASAVAKGTPLTEEQIAQMNTILSLLQAISNLPQPDVLDFSSLINSLSSVSDQDWEGSLSPAISAIQGIVDAASKANSGLSEIDDASMSSVSSQADGLSGALSGISDSADDAKGSISNVNDESMSSVKGQINGVSRAMVQAGTAADDLKTKLDELDGRTVNVTVNVSGGQVPAAATGKKHAKKGVHLVDDGTGMYAGPELIIHRKAGTYEIGSGDSPRLTHLDAGDTVLNAIQTRQALRNGGANIGDSFATGTAPVIPPSSGSTPSSSSSSSNKKKKKTKKKPSASDIEALFDELRHLFAMEQITAEEFYRRLGELNDKYYKNNKKKLKEYRSLLEEIYAWEKEYLLNRIDMQIDYIELIRGTYDEDSEEYKLRTEELFNLQEEKQKIIEDQLARYRELGFEEDSDILMELKTQWFEIEKWKREEIIKTHELELSKYETATNAVISLIDDEIEKLNEQKKALQDANKAQEEKIELAKLEENLMRARKNKTIRIYRENLGFVFEQDTKAIEDAEKALRDFNLKEQIDAIDKSIDAWEKYKKQWQSVATDYQKSQDALMAAQVLGADWESSILDQRLDTLEDFKANYLRIQAELLAAQQAVINAQPSTGSSSGGKERIVDVTDDEVYEVDWVTGERIEKERIVAVKDNEVYEVPWVDDIEDLLKKKKGYASGTRSATRGIHPVDELGSELIVSPNKGRYTYLEAGSQVMTANLAKNIFSMAQNPLGWIKDALSKMPQFNAKSSGSSNVVSIGDIHIHNPVGDTDAFARELNNTLGLRGLQISFDRG